MYVGQVVVVGLAEAIREHLSVMESLIQRRAQL